MRHITLIVWTCILIFLISGNSYAAAPDNSELIIVPGVGVGRLKIGAKIGQAGHPDGIKIETVEPGIVKKIKVSHSRYSVQYNHLRVGDELQKIFRFYRKFSKEASSRDLTIIRDPGHGIEFSVDMKTEKITEIGIFEPDVPDYYKRKTQREEAAGSESQTKSQKESLKNYYKENLNLK
jgi:hypothetical protein